MAPPRPLGPAPGPAMYAPASERLPSQEAHTLRGHEGPVLAVRFNTQGTYCMTCGKVRVRRSGPHPPRTAWGRPLLNRPPRPTSTCHLALLPLAPPPLPSPPRCRTAPCGCGTRTAASPSRCTQGTATTCGTWRSLRTTASEGEEQQQQQGCEDGGVLQDVSLCDGSLLLLTQCSPTSAGLHHAAATARCSCGTCPRAASCASSAGTTPTLIRCVGGVVGGSGGGQEEVDSSAYAAAAAAAGHLSLFPRLLPPSLLSQHHFRCPSAASHCLLVCLLPQVCYSPGDEVLVSGGYDQAVKVWDCRSRSIDAVQVMKPFRDSVTSVAVTPRWAAARCAALEVDHYHWWGRCCHQLLQLSSCSRRRLMQLSRAVLPLLLPGCGAGLRSWQAAWTGACGALTCAWGACSQTSCTTLSLASRVSDAVLCGRADAGARRAEPHPSLIAVPAPSPHARPLAARSEP